MMMTESLRYRPTLLLRDGPERIDQVETSLFFGKKKRPDVYLDVGDKRP